MQRTTMSSYPNLVPITPIHGVVYKAKTVSRPHPKIFVMPIKEVIMHQQQESVAIFMPEESRKDSFFHLQKKKRTKKLKNKPRASNTMAPEYTEELLDSASTLKVLKGYDEFEDKKASPFRRLKSALKKHLHRIIPATKSHHETRNPSISEQHPLNSGFSCSQKGCASCSPPRPLSSTTVPRMDVRPLHDPQHRHNGILNTKILEPLPRAASFSSGFTYTSSTATADLDIFYDFNGVHIEVTPPQLAPMRPVSSFKEELQGTIIEKWMDTESSDDEKRGEEGSVDETFLTTPEVEATCTPEVSSTQGSEDQGGCEDPATPCPKGRSGKRERGRTLLFMENVGGMTLEAVLSSGAAAQRRRSSRV